MWLRENRCRGWHSFLKGVNEIKPLNAELNPICHLLALVGAHRILHVNRVRVKPAHAS